MDGRPGRPVGWLAAALESPKGGTTGLAATAWLCQIIKVSKGEKASRGNTREIRDKEWGGEEGDKQASYTMKTSGTVESSRSPGLIGLTIFRNLLLCIRDVSCKFGHGGTRTRTRTTDAINEDLVGEISARWD